MDFNAEDLRILIVDDTVKNLQILGSVLEQEGFQINIAQNGLEALEVAEKARPDLILLDIIMPDLDGFEVCKRLKADDVLCEIPVIFLTAKVETDDIVKGFEMGAVDYVTKPFQATELLVRVRTHLSIHLLGLALRRSLEENARMTREHEALLRHELRNRITPILGYAEILNQIAQDDRGRRSAKKIFDSAQDMARLIDTLKDLQDLEGGSLALSKIPLDFGVFIQRVIDGLKASFEFPVEIVFEDQGDAIQIEADGNLLLGVFHNLIKNAVEHVSDLDDVVGRVVRVRLTGESEHVVVSIHNGGVPISEDRVASFFEKFNTYDKSGGTGLGTTYAALVTRAHGGEIDVVSNEAEGTMVTVRLPEE